MNDLNLDPLWDAIISSYLDPGPVQFKTNHKAGKRILSTILNKPIERLYVLENTILRNSFLYGCNEFTEDEVIEHLIVGFGKKRSMGTDIIKVFHVLGTSTSVIIPENLIDYIQKYLMSDFKAEVVIFHNHPRNWLTSSYPIGPIASNTDRWIAITSKLEPLYLLRTFLRGGGLKYYVGERGLVKEIRWPSIMQMIRIHEELKSNSV